MKLSRRSLLKAFAGVAASVAVPSLSGNTIFSNVEAVESLALPPIDGSSWGNDVSVAFAVPDTNDIPGFEGLAFTDAGSLIEVPVISVNWDIVEHTTVSGDEKMVFGQEVNFGTSTKGRRVFDPMDIKLAGMGSDAREVLRSLEMDRAGVGSIRIKVEKSTVYFTAQVYKLFDATEYDDYDQKTGLGLLIQQPPVLQIA